MKISIIGGGAFGATIAQVLAENGHETLVYDVKQANAANINKSIHPVFNEPLNKTIKATTSLVDLVDFSDFFVLAIPTKFIRSQLKELNKILKNDITIVNLSKGIETNTGKTISVICREEITKLAGYVVLTGPSHAEDLFEHKLTLLLSASTNNELATFVQLVFSNDKYLRIYTSHNVIGAELGGVAKNAIAVVSGMCMGLELGENARAALLTRGLGEISRLIIASGGEQKTAFGLAGVGDLFVTATSKKSRNYIAGIKIGAGVPIDDVYTTCTQTIEGINNIAALKMLSENLGVELPIICQAYEVIFNKVNFNEVINYLLSRELKTEH